MAILDINKYHYFKLRNGSPYKIVDFLVPIDTSINRVYVAFTSEQLEFYLAHPTANVMEVWNCELTPPYVPPTPDVQEYAAMKVNELKNACYASVTITSLEYAVAEDKVNNVLANSYYSLTEANSLLSDFRSQSKKALTVFYTYKPQIEAASTIEEVDTIYEQAINNL